MRIGFFGTPEIAAYCLKKLLCQHQIDFIVTKEDKPVGRRQKIQISPVKEVALAHKVKIFQPSSLNEVSFQKELKSFSSDLFIVVAYGKIIPKEIYNFPPFKTINLHPSLLPLYRGAAPLQWALINGEKETGITIQMINDNLDEGDLLLQKKISIEVNQSTGDLYKIVQEKGSELLEKTINLISTRKIKSLPQDNSKATFCQKIDRNLAKIDWSWTAVKIHNLVRGLNPKPVAWTLFKGRNIKIWQTSLLSSSRALKLEPGSLIKDNKKLLIQTGDSLLEIKNLQPEGKQRMDGGSFCNGYRIKENDSFE